MLAEADTDISRGKQTGDELWHRNRKTLNLWGLGGLWFAFGWGNGKNYSCFRQDDCRGSSRASLGLKARGREHGMYMALMLSSRGHFSSRGPGDLRADLTSVSVGQLECKVF